MKKLILLMILVAPFRLLAQKNVTGTVYDYENRTTPLQNVTIRNLTTKTTVATKAEGQFNIPAKIGDVLEVSYNGYHTDSLYLVDLQSKTIYLPPSSTSLQEVKIRSTKVSDYLNVKPDPNAKGATRVGTDGFEGKKNTDRAGGLTLGLGHGKMKREREKVQLLEAKDVIETEIRENFNDSTVYELTKLKGQDLKDFVSMYRPTAARVKSDAPFNYSLYIAQALQTWRSLPADQKRLPPVPKLKKN
jgi:hypothetical protein